MHRTRQHPLRRLAALSLVWLFGCVLAYVSAISGAFEAGRRGASGAFTLTVFDDPEMKTSWQQGEAWFGGVLQCFPYYSGYEATTARATSPRRIPAWLRRHVPRTESPNVRGELIWSSYGGWPFTCVYYVQSESGAHDAGHITVALGKREFGFAVIPIWPRLLANGLLIAATLAAASALIRRTRRRRRRRAHRCEMCAYPVAGARCPECGHDQPPPGP